MRLIQKLFLSVFLCTCYLGISASANASTTDSAKPTDLPVSFYHNDWQLECDNTRTCRAVGYQDEYADDWRNPVALMLKREAGETQAVTGYVMLGDGFGTDDDGMAEDEQPTCALSENADNEDIYLIINHTNYGQVTKRYVERDYGEQAWQLTDTQVTALLTTLPNRSHIVFKCGCKNYIVSDVGSTAVLLKMDEVQGRVGTSSAIVKKGNQSLTKVLPVVPAPVITVKKVVDNELQRASDTVLFAKLQSLMSKAVLSDLPQSDDEATDAYCDAVTEATDNNNNGENGANVEARYSNSDWSFYRLNNHQLLAEHLCWTAAYNAGMGYWLINDTAPYQPKLITTEASGYLNGSIYASQKGRGIGDCWWTSRWQWTGQSFVQTHEANTGMCKMIAGGGAFELPSLVTVVKQE